MNRTLYLLGIAIGCMVCCCDIGSVRSQIISYKTREVANSLNCPWEIRWGKDNWIWFTERAGRFNRVNPETGERHVLLAESEVYSLGELGMLGFDFHPDFPDSPYVFIDYTYADSTSVKDTVLYFEKVVRYRVRHDSIAALASSHDTLVDRITYVDHIRAYSAHNGSRVLVGPDRKLYITTGETYFDPGLAQQDSSINGKILRINLDGSIPDDNPWPGSRVWTKGHRNPQGLWFGPDGTLYESEHGPANDDEFNIIERGRNYGWPSVEGFCDKPEEMTFCADSNVVEPVAAWTPTLAVCGIEYYNSDRIPEWKNSILLMTLKDESLWHLKLDDSHRTVVQQNRYNLRLRTTPSDTGELAGRLRDVCISPDGRVFVSTSNVWSIDWVPDHIFEIIRTGLDGVEVPQSGT
ncbi:MAG: PQQ-dependent sugar dehydrogenase [Bacteroidetes bacterium]|nr:PQQ-dependent sugar dehydrogenase [Bacteroidota bacterium]